MLQANGSYGVRADNPIATITGTGANPPVVAPGQTMTFGVTVDQPAGVDRVELFFPDANVTEQMTPSSANTWNRQRQMTQPGENRTYVVKVYRKGAPMVQANGSYGVKR